MVRAYLTRNFFFFAVHIFIYLSESESPTVRAVGNNSPLSSFTRQFFYQSPWHWCYITLSRRLHNQHCCLCLSWQDAVWYHTGAFTPPRLLTRNSSSSWRQWYVISCCRHLFSRRITPGYEPDDQRNPTPASNFRISLFAPFVTSFYHAFPAFSLKKIT